MQIKHTLSHIIYIPLMYNNYYFVSAVGEGPKENFVIHESCTNITFDYAQSFTIMVILSMTF